VSDHVILTLETIEKPRQYVKVNGEMYPIANLDELGTLQQFRMFKMVEQVQPLIAKAEAGTISGDEVLTMTALLDELVGYILPTLPADFLGKKPVEGGLSDHQKMQIVEAFTRLVGQTSAPAGPASGQPARKGSRSRKSTLAASSRS